MVYVLAGCGPMIGPVVTTAEIGLTIGPVRSPMRYFAPPAVKTVHKGVLATSPATASTVETGRTIGPLSATTYPHAYLPAQNPSASAPSAFPAAARRCAPQHPHHSLHAATPSERRSTRSAPPHRLQPFTPPCVNPEMSCLCSNRKMVTIGIEAMSAPAANTPQRRAY